MGYVATACADGEGSSQYATSAAGNETSGRASVNGALDSVLDTAQDAAQAIAGPAVLKTLATSSPWTRAAALLLAFAGVEITFDSLKDVTGSLLPASMGSGVKVMRGSGFTKEPWAVTANPHVNGDMAVVMEQSDGSGCCACFQASKALNAMMFEDPDASAIGSVAAVLFEKGLSQRQIAEQLIPVAPVQADGYDRGQKDGSIFYQTTVGWVQTRIYAPPHAGQVRLWVGDTDEQQFDVRGLRDSRTEVNEAFSVPFDHYLRDLGLLA